MVPLPWPPLLWLVLIAPKLIAVTERLLERRQTQSRRKS
jgi:hypothetical protein